MKLFEIDQAPGWAPCRFGEATSISHEASVASATDAQGNGRPCSALISFTSNRNGKDGSLEIRSGDRGKSPLDLGINVHVWIIPAERCYLIRFDLHLI